MLHPAESGNALPSAALSKFGVGKVLIQPQGAENEKADKAEGSVPHFAPLPC